jgi:hypothetical protein
LSFLLDGRIILLRPERMRDRFESGVSNGGLGGNRCACREFVLVKGWAKRMEGPSRIDIGERCSRPA